jgi:hypothetical protein
MKETVAIDLVDDSSQSSKDILIKDKGTTRAAAEESDSCSQESKSALKNEQ